MTNESIQRGTATFRPRARLLKIIGSELISDEVVAITELVKNAHDADASCVTLQFNGITNKGGTIEIIDDGHGMDLDTLLRHWMEPAGSSKRGKHRRRTAKGRPMLGEKGVGRFAVDKLGQKLELLSRCPDDPRELKALFDWDDYEDDEQSLSDIINHYELRPARELTHNGTTLRISALRTPWNERMFRKLCSSLSRLRSPFGEADGFSIYIKSDEFPQYAGELRSSFIERAPYRLDARFDGDETIQISLDNNPAEEYGWSAAPLTCGPIRIRLFVFDLEQDALSRLGPRMEARAWLKECSGISIYRDGFRLWPYGEPHNDWLRLDQRRVNNPVLRLSNNQVVGFVEISSDGNPELRDQTNREGLIHNQAYEDLCALIRKVLQVIELERQARRHPQAEKRSSTNTTARDSEGSFTAMLDRLAEKASETSFELAGEIQKVARRLEESQRMESVRQLKLQQSYSELAAAGQVIDSYAPLMRQQLASMRERCAGLRPLGQSAPDLSEMLSGLESSIMEMALHLSVLSPALVSTKERRRTIDLCRELAIASERTRPLLEAARIPPLELELPESGALRTDLQAESFHRVIHILVTNAMEWLQGCSAPRIRVSAFKDDANCVVVFSDSGQGIPAEMRERVFEPHFSCKDYGQGMGLAIARNLVEQAGGTIEVMPASELGGASFRITFSRKRTAQTTER